VEGSPSLLINVKTKKFLQGTTSTARSSEAIASVVRRLRWWVSLSSTLVLTQRGTEH
jgi:hypothetical protein